MAGLLAGLALVSAACSGNHRPATNAAAGPAFERGSASWYGPKFNGRRTASGERYDQHLMTAAHPTLPFGTLVQVTNLANGRRVVVRINDRGPFAHRRIIDLSYEAAKQLQIVGPGTAKVELALLNHGDALPPPTPAVESMVLAANRANELPALSAPADATRGSSDGRQAQPEPDAAGAASPTAGAAAMPAAAVATEDSAGDDAGAFRFTVQVGAFGEPERAEARRRELLPAYPDAAVHSDGTWNRVQIGLFSDREAAEALRHELAGQGVAAIVVTAR